MNEIVSHSNSHKVKFKIDGFDKSYDVILPFIKSTNKFLFIAMDCDNSIYVYAQMPNFEDHSYRWSNKKFIDKEKWKTFAYAKLAKYEGDLKFDYKEIYMIDNPFLINHYDDTSIQVVLLCPVNK